jgi:hypothetical protein
VSKIYRSAVEATSEIKAGKIILIGDDHNMVWATVEMFLPDEQAFNASFNRNLSILVTIVAKFATLVAPETAIAA